MSALGSGLEEHSCLCGPREVGQWAHDLGAWPHRGAFTTCYGSRQALHPPGSDRLAASASACVSSQPSPARPPQLLSNEHRAHCQPPAPTPDSRLPTPAPQNEVGTGAACLFVVPSHPGFCFRPHAGGASASSHTRRHLKYWGPELRTWSTS